MIKKMFAAILIFASLPSFAQVDTVISYANVIRVDNAKQNDLFSNARMWVDNNFKNSKAVISVNDKESGELAGKGVMDLMIYYMRKKNYEVPVSIKFQFNVRTKDGKYKYEFTNFDIIRFWDQGDNDFGILRSVVGDKTFASQKKWNQSAYDQIREQVDAQINLLSTSLKTEMVKKNDF